MSAGPRPSLPGESSRELQTRRPAGDQQPAETGPDTAQLAGLTVDEVSPLLAEWDYGSYEGLTTPQIHEVGSRLAGLDARLSRR